MWDRCHQCGYRKPDDVNEYSDRDYDDHESGYLCECEVSDDELTPAQEQKNNLLNLQLGRITAFKSQDTEHGNFDISFDLSGKLLHAHRFIFTAVSTPMEAMISERWSTKDEAIKIETYTYEEFFQFLIFLYSGTCEITQDNIFRLVDMAEFFDVAVMKRHCDTILSEMMEKISIENVEEMMEMAQRYSLSNSIDVLRHFICRSMKNIIELDRFVKIKRPFLDVLLSFEYYVDHQKLFLSVFKWAEHQVSIKKPTLEKSEFVNAVKAELDEIQYDFSRIKRDFVLEFFASKDFECSIYDIYKFLSECYHGQFTEENVLKTIFEMAEKQALKEKTTSIDENFDLQEVIKRELSGILPIVNYKLMTLDFVKKFVVDKEFLFSSEELYEIIDQCKKSDEEEYFKTIFEIAEKKAFKEHTTSIDENFDLQEVIKRELSGILPRVNFKRMKLEFVKKFVVEKAFLFSSKELYEIIDQCQRNGEEEYFQTIFEIAEKRALKEHTTLIDENFDLQEVIKRELSESLPKVNFKLMKLDFVKKFVVEKAFLFSAKELYEIIDQCQRNGEEKYLQTIFEIAKKRALKEKTTSIDENFDLQEVIKRELSEMLPKVNYKLVTLDFVRQFVVNKAFLFPSKELHEIIDQCQRDDEEEYFIVIFEIAKRQALKEKTTSIDENFNLQEAIERKLNEINASVKFDEMTFGFIEQFIVDKAFLFYAKELYEIIAECRRTDDEESELFGILYHLAKKNVEKRKSSGEIIDVPNAIKMELSECLPKIKFHKMDKAFLIYFAAKTGLISREEAIQCFYVRVQINNGGKSLIGNFEDVLKLHDCVRSSVQCFDSEWALDIGPRRENRRLVFYSLKFEVPESPSPIQKMRGAEWYLLLDRNGRLAVKHESLVKHGDYLIGELHANEDFYFDGQETSITVCRNKIF